VHEWFVAIGRMIASCRPLAWLIDLVYGYHGPRISKTVDGITYRTPFLLSAGFDYNGHLTRTLGHIGLGGEEVGSVTARPCAGNPAPRLTRLPRSQSILVNKGLKNDGVDVVIGRLKAAERRANTDSGFVVGISIARTNDTCSVSVEEGIADYLYSFKRLNEAGVGDYYTINISCPNSFGGEAFTTPELLTKLVNALKTVPCTKPVYVKMPINIPWDQFNSLLKVIDVAGFQGVVIGNLNKDYHSLDVAEDAPKTFKGGLSGKPCTHVSTDLIYKTRETFGRRFTIIGVGGVMSVETMKEKFDAGADLIQVITGMIFEGPGLIKKMGKAYATMKGK
jgi:dihydroorotate dehydrogenase